MTEQKLILLKKKHVQEVRRLVSMYHIENNFIQVHFESHLKGDVCCKTYLDFGTGSNELLVIKSYYEIVKQKTFVIHELTRDLPF